MNNNTQSGRGYLFRASSSDICNYDCAFCHPNEHEPVDILSNIEFINIFEAAFSLFKIKGLHFTGGEPLMRKDIAELIGACRKISGPELDIALTTNGFLLNHQLDLLRAAGLSRVNVSLHSLDPLKYKEFIRTDVNVDQIKKNVLLAKQAGLGVKLNMVVIRDFNFDAIIDALLYAFENKLIIRFLELGLYGPVKKWFNENDFVPHQEIIERVNRDLGSFERDYAIRGNGPTKYYRNKKGYVFGILDNQSDKKCCGCDRFRMSANGIVKACNFSLVQDMRPIVNSPQKLIEAFRKLEDQMISRGTDYVGKRNHVCDYDFRWNNPKNLIYKNNEC